MSNDEGKQMKKAFSNLQKCVKPFCEVEKSRAKHQVTISWKYNGVPCVVGISHSPSDTNAHKRVNRRIRQELIRCGIAKRLTPNLKSRMGIAMMVSFEFDEAVEAFARILEAIDNKPYKAYMKEVKRATRNTRKIRFARQPVIRKPYSRQIKFDRNGNQVSYRGYYVWKELYVGDEVGNRIKRLGFTSVKESEYLEAMIEWKKVEDKNRK